MSVPLARRNLLHEKGKLVLSVSGVAAALTLIVLLMGFRDGLYATLTAYLDNTGADLVVAQSGVKGLFSSRSAIPVAIHDELVSALSTESTLSEAEGLRPALSPVLSDSEGSAEVTGSGAVEAGHVLVADVIFSHGEAKTPVLLVGYNPETGRGGPWNLDTGRALRGDDEIVLDTWLARRAGLAVGDDVELLGRTFTMVGLTRETASWMSSYIFISQNTAEEVLQLAGIASFYLLRLPVGADVAAAAEAIEAQVAGVEALTPAEMAAADRAILAAVMDTPLNVMLFISVVIGVAVMGLTAYTAIVDRMREYGVLKAIGAGGGWLGRLVVLETLYSAAVGFALGSGLSYFVAALIMRLWPQFTIVIRLPAVAAAGVAALVMTVFAALLPIRRVAAVDPAVVFKA